MSEQNVEFDAEVIKGTAQPSTQTDEEAAVAAAQAKAQAELAEMPEGSVAEILAKERASQLLGNEEKPLDMEKIESLLQWDGTVQGGVELERTLQLLGSDKTFDDYAKPTGNALTDDAAGAVRDLLGFRPTAPTSTGGGGSEGTSGATTGSGESSAGGGGGGATSGGGGSAGPGYLDPDMGAPIPTYNGGYGGSGGTSTAGTTTGAGGTTAGAGGGSTGAAGGGSGGSGFTPITPVVPITEESKNDAGERVTTTTYTDEDGNQVTQVTTYHDGNNGATTTTTTTGKDGTEETKTESTRTESKESESTTEPEPEPEPEPQPEPETLTTADDAGGGGRTIDEAIDFGRIKGDSVINPSGEEEAVTPERSLFGGGVIDPPQESSVFEPTGIVAPVTAGPEFGEGGPETPEVPDGWTPDGSGPMTRGSASSGADVGSDAADTGFDRIGDLTSIDEDAFSSQLGALGEVDRTADLEGDDRPSFDVE